MTIGEPGLELRRRKVVNRAFVPIMRDLIDRGEWMPLEEIAAALTEAIEADPVLEAMDANRIDRLDANVLAAETVRGYTRAAPLELARREAARERRRLEEGEE